MHPATRRHLLLLITFLLTPLAGCTAGGVADEDGAKHYGDHGTLRACDLVIREVRGLPNDDCTTGCTLDLAMDVDASSAFFAEVGLQAPTVTVGGVEDDGFRLDARLVTLDLSDPAKPVDGGFYRQTAKLSYEVPRLASPFERYMVFFSQTEYGKSVFVDEGASSVDDSCPDLGGYDAQVGFTRGAYQLGDQSDENNYLVLEGRRSSLQYDSARRNDYSQLYLFVDTEEDEYVSVTMVARPLVDGVPDNSGAVRLESTMRHADY